jgi:Glycosyltransferase family 17
MPPPSTHRSSGSSKAQRLSLVAWGGLALLAALATTLPVMQTANRHLQEKHRDDDSSSKWSFLSYQSMGLKQQGSQLQREVAYDDDTVTIGILSGEPQSYYHAIQQSIDSDNLTARCMRYGFSMNPKANSSDPARPHRRIFYGSLIAEEPWELLEIISAETFGIFEAMVFVEGNRTQSGTPRPFKRTNKHLAKLQKLFGVNNIQLRRYVNEDTSLDSMAREHRQRQEILKGWKDFGMTGNDVGYIADMDETFTRDFLRAVQTCPYIEALDYETHHCFNPKVKIAGYTRMFESSPECIAKRTWYHPDMILGACVELIGNETLNPLAPRVHDFLRAPGYAHNCETRNDMTYQNSFGKINGSHFPLWSAADFRRQCGGHNYKLNATGHAEFSAFHFHNFFPDFNATRRKYGTYAHAVTGADRKRLENIGDDLKMMVRCVQNWTDAPTSGNGVNIAETQQWQRVVGGIDAALPPWPIYFMDIDYRRRKHQSVQAAVNQDELERQVGLKPHERNFVRLVEEAKELRRQAWAKEAEARTKEAEAWELHEKFSARNAYETSLVKARGGGDSNVGP